jgi:hypothetical protein
MPYVAFAAHPINEMNENDMTEIPKNSHQPINKEGENETNNSPDKSDRPMVHGSQTLDQFYYRSVPDTTDRDERQVVLRYQKEEEEKRILRVDHLWLWVIDHRMTLAATLQRLISDVLLSRNRHYQLYKPPRWG